jgi:serine/threonine-protein kinase
VQAIIASARGDRWTADAARSAFLHQTSEPCANPDITLGRASVLLGLMLLLEAPGSSDDDLLVARGDELYETLLAVLQAEPAIGQPGAIEYLGMAHGWAGLLYATLRWSQLRKNEPNPIIRQRLDQLASYARFTRRGARWPVQAKAGSISLPGWCNGSAGYTHLWTLAHQIYKIPADLDLAQRSAMDAFEGVGGGHGLCCGFAGQAYAQLALYKHTGLPTWLDQARTLAEKAAATANTVDSHGAENLPFSLYKGDIGVAVLIAELERPEHAAMPFFEAIRQTLMR